ncbi:uncharacterized protein BDR25DRAFT_351251 [Lindgomyces ingoldianus]|uniref:Uncharacterized protein n=1 Tax=Lindgomyces ingoldianus TaxID=673940 RepID=A0ACB6R7E5_9PLEO|nr:uncharacterized protein BDR25DRAFT_351251 [Lindgomyces ingoldianus]KAF2474728.1 hypothetical protein BDR25DRAFT_351251 [Lindgomyces ingoldianus]
MRSSWRYSRYLLPASSTPREKSLIKFSKLLIPYMQDVRPTQLSWPIVWLSYCPCAEVLVAHGAKYSGSFCGCHKTVFFLTVVADEKGGDRCIYVRFSAYANKGAMRVTHFYSQISSTVYLEGEIYTMKGALGLLVEEDYKRIAFWMTLTLESRAVLIWNYPIYRPHSTTLYSEVSPSNSNSSPGAPETFKAMVKEIARISKMYLKIDAGSYSGDFLRTAAESTGIVGKGIYAVGALSDFT